MSSGPEHEIPPVQQVQQLNQVLPPAFLEDPAGFLASVASQAPSRTATAQLAGPVASFLSQGQGHGAPVTAASTSATSAETPGGQSSQIAAMYLQAAAKQLVGDIRVGDMEQEMLRAQQHYEILEVSLKSMRPSCQIVASKSQLTGFPFAHFALRTPCFFPGRRRSCGSMPAAIPHFELRYLSCACPCDD